MPKKMSDLDEAALEALVDRVNEDVPETPENDLPGGGGGGGGCKEEQKVEINQRHALDSSLSSQESGNSLLESALPFPDQLHLNYSVDWALKMKKVAAAAEEAAAATAARKNKETELKLGVKWDCPVGGE